MRFLRRSVVLSLLLTGCGIRALAQQQSLTDAQLMDLAGPVKSVSVTTTQTGLCGINPAARLWFCRSGAGNASSTRMETAPSADR